MTDYNPYAPPAAGDADKSTSRRSARSAARVELTLPYQTRFGKVCVKCAARKDIEFRRKRLPYVPPLAYGSVLLCGVIGFIFVLVMRKERELEVPLCVECEHRWGRALMIGAVVQAGLVVLMLAATVLLAIALPETRLAALATFTIAALLFFLERRLEERDALRIVSIERTGLVLRFVHPKTVRMMRRI